MAIALSNHVYYFHEDILCMLFMAVKFFFDEVSDSDVKSYNGEKFQSFITQIKIRIYAKTGLNALFQAKASLFNFCNKQHVILDLLQDM